MSDANRDPHAPSHVRTSRLASFAAALIAGLVAAGFFYAIERRTAEALVIAIIVVPSLYASSTRRSRSTRFRHRRVV
jgi:cation transporter-like permease